MKLEGPIYIYSEEKIKINGVDLISWNKENKIIEFRVLIRPLKGVQLIHELMGGTLEKV